MSFKLTLRDGVSAAPEGITLGPFHKLAWRNTDLFGYQRTYGYGVSVVAPHWLGCSKPHKSLGQVFHAVDSMGITIGDYETYDISPSED